jgi:hypothetical protein
MRMRDTLARLPRTDTEQARFDVIDAEIDWIARGLGARGVHYPALIGRSALERAGYPESFPHLLLSASRSDCSSTAWCLSPAVCYHVYEQFAGQALTEPLALTARGLCFRGEQGTAPGIRQIEFEMREIVFLGPSDWVLAQSRAAVDRLTTLAGRLGLCGEWQPAEDPFFLPAAAGKALMQRLLGVKEEYRSGGPDGLALASVNRHGTFFGDRFGIGLADGSAVHTACVAVGLDRWHALRQRELTGERENGRTGETKMGLRPARRSRRPEEHDVPYTPSAAAAALCAASADGNSEP